MEVKEPGIFWSSYLGTREGTINQENKNREGIDSVNRCFLKAFSVGTTIICFEGFLECIDCVVTVSLWEGQSHVPITDSRGRGLCAYKKAEVESCSCSQEARSYLWAQGKCYGRRNIWRGVLENGRIWMCRGGCEETRKVPLQKNWEQGMEGGISG